MLRSAIVRSWPRRLSAVVLTAVLVALATPASSPVADGGPQPPQPTQPSAPGTGPFPVSVLVITMFGEEITPWLENEGLSRKIEVPGSEGPLRCDDRGLCVADIGVGKANAAVSMMSILDSPELDFSNAYFITAGIAGTPPDEGTLGFAAWARWVVDFDLGHHLLPESAPEVPQGYLPFDAEGTNAFRLNDDLVELAYKLTKDLELADSAEAARNRSRYPGQRDQTPYVDVCDTITGDDYWAGEELSERAQYITELWTQGQGTYCTSQMEDTAVAAALSARGYLDRYLSLRTASDFDQPYEGQSITELLSEFPGYEIAVTNAYLTVSTVVEELLACPPN